MIKRASGWIFILLMAIACHDEDGLVFQGIQLRDATNQDIGTKGASDLNDWQNDGTLSSDILELLAFDVEDLAGTETSTDIYISGYPNPVSNHVSLKFLLSHNSRVRLVVVDESMQVLHQTSFSGTADYGIAMFDPKKFVNGKIVRVYYSISSEQDENFYVGHGDVWICRESDCL